jgi:hypothetical protein
MAVAEEDSDDEEDLAEDGAREARGKGGEARHPLLGEGPPAKKKSVRKLGRGRRMSPIVRAHLDQIREIADSHPDLVEDGPVGHGLVRTSSFGQGLKNLQRHATGTAGDDMMSEADRSEVGSQDTTQLAHGDGGALLSPLTAGRGTRQEYASADEEILQALSSGDEAQSSRGRTGGSKGSQQAAAGPSPARAQVQVQMWRARSMLRLRRALHSLTVSPLLKLQQSGIIPIAGASDGTAVAFGSVQNLSSWGGAAMEGRAYMLRWRPPDYRELRMMRTIVEKKLRSTIRGIVKDPACNAVKLIDEESKKEAARSAGDPGDVFQRSAAGGEGGDSSATPEAAALSKLQAGSSDAGTERPDEPPTGSAAGEP